METPTRRIRVLVVDDSAIVRKILTETLSRESDFEVVGTAPDPYVARDKILALNPDVLTLDIEMPRMDGLTFLRNLMEHRPMPVIVVSSVGETNCRAAVRALELGAVDVLTKPGGPYSVGELQHSLAERVRAAAVARLRGPAQETARPAVVDGTEPVAPKKPIAGRTASGIPSPIIAIGASTGGTEAIRHVLRGLEPGSAGFVVTQHIPAHFSAAFANGLNNICSLEVREAKDGDAVVPGRVLIAPGNFHMVLRKDARGYRVGVMDGPLVCYQRPSVDVLFSSVASAAGRAAMGILLTGMGNDGAAGLLQMHKAGSWTAAQDEASCVVFGMPREAIRLGAVDAVMSLDRITETMATANAGAMAGVK
ncbi:MAG TPA: chemotaxis response regulator protein-glutamate methylesterase [Bryobacteraceae bacterium]|nr:chemotaxis response regulator protein-glutamate methylesterase [Bryobacteraceae bacterium]